MSRHHAPRTPGARRRAILDRIRRRESDQLRREPLTAEARAHLADLFAVVSL